MADEAPPPLVDQQTVYTRWHLSRFAGAGLDPYTINFVRLMCQDNLKLSVHGQRNYNQALNNLPIYRTSDERLCFGWATEHLITNPKTHEFSYEHLVLSSALGESFPEDYGSSVLFAMARKFEPRVDGISPHYWQLKGFLHFTNGLIASVEFGLLVTRYIERNPYRRFVDRYAVINLPQPEIFAEVLWALADVIRGTKSQLTLVGGDVAGWFAAYAEWALGLEVAIFDEEGRETTTNPAAQLKVVYVNDARPDVKVLADNFEGAIMLETIRSTTSTPRQSTMFYGGRVPWDSLLSKVFGASYRELEHHHYKALGTLFGSTARAFEGLLSGEGFAMDPDVLAEHKASWGPGLLVTATAWLPELRHMQGPMERAARAKSGKEAGQAYRAQIKLLQELCKCDICSHESDAEPEHPLHGPANGGYCLPVLVETIIALALALQRLTVSPSLYPSAAGVKCMYAAQISNHLAGKSLPAGSEHFQKIYGNEWNASVQRRLQCIAALFTGSWPNKADLPSNLVALSHHGICAYLLKIGKNGHSSDHDSTIRVVSGGVGWRQKVFNLGSLGPPQQQKGEDGSSSNDSSTLGWEALEYEHLGQRLYCK